MRPRGFRVHEVRRQGRDAAPVVDAGGDDLRQHAWAQVRRRLDAHLRAEQNPRHGDGPQQFVQVRLRRLAHLGAWLGAKVLDDDLLDVAVFGVDAADGEQRLDAFQARLADADENAGGEGHPRPSGIGQRLQAHGGNLVRRAVVRHALLGEPLGCGFQHDAHGGRDGPQLGDLRRRHVARVQVRQQPGFLEHGLGGVAQVVEGRRVAVLGQPLPRRPIAQFGLFAQGEERFLAAHPRPVPRHVEHRFQAHVRDVQLGGRLREGAVVADVAAQMRERNEDLARIGDEIAEAAVAQFGRNRAQRCGVGAGRQGERFVVRGQRARTSALQQFGGGSGHEGDAMLKNEPDPCRSSRRERDERPQNRRQHCGNRRLRDLRLHMIHQVAAGADGA